MVGHPDNCYFCIKVLLSGFPQTGYVKKGGSGHPFFFQAREVCEFFAEKVGHFRASSCGSLRSSRTSSLDYITLSGKATKKRSHP